MMMSNAERLVYMANQISRNLALGKDPVAATADHLARFWDPRMLRQIIACLDLEPAEFDDIAASAVRLLRDKPAPGPQSQATDFNTGDELSRSDAG
jgi:formate dehydrogenase subunit delta